MKGKFLIPILFSIAIGFLFGKLFFNQYDSQSITTFEEGKKIYFIQKGVYSSFDSLKKSNSDYNYYLSLKEDDGYHYYIGITKDEKIANSIKDYYLKKDNNIYIKEKYVSNVNFLSILAEYDKLSGVASDKSLVELQKIVISNYKEMVLNGEDVN